MKEGETPEQALRVAARFYPEAFKLQEEKPRQDTTGLKAAASAGFTRLGGEFELLKGKTGIKSEAEAQKEYEAAQAKAAARFTPTEKGWTEDPLLKFRETLGGSLPYMALPATAGLAALTAPVSAPVAAGLGLLGAGAVSAGQFTGSNLAAQMGTGKSLEEASLGKAVAAAVPQALVDTAAMALLPGVGKLFSSVGSKLTTEQAKAIASQTLSKTIADYTAKTGMAMGREGFTEVVQQSLERLQAGLSITDPEARKEYIESFIGGAVLGGTLAPAGRYLERSGARKQAEEADAQDKAAAKAAAAQAKAAADAEEEARKQTPEYMRQVVAESAALEKQKRDLQAQIVRAPKGETLTEEQKQANVVINAQLKELAPKLTEAAKESNRVKPLLAQLDANARVVAEEARLAGLSPEEFFAERAAAAPGITPAEAKPVEGDPFATATPTSPVVAFAQRIKALADAQSIATPEIQDYVAYVMTDPAMAYQMVRTGTALPGMTRKQANAFLGALALQLKALEKQNTRLGTAARSAAQQRLGTVEAEEQAALEEAQRQRAILEADAARESETAPARMQQMLLGQKPGENLLAAMQTQPGVVAARAEQAQREQAEAQSRAEAAAAAAAEAARLKKVTPEVEALQRIAGRPAVGVANLINRLPIETPAQATTRAGSSVMGRTAQDLQGLPIGAEGQPIYTAEEEKAPEAESERAPATRVKGEFRLFNQRGEPARASDTKNIQERLARVLAEADLDQDAYDFLRRAEDIAPTASPEVLSLLDRQLERIERGEEGIVGPEVKGERPARYQGFPVQGTRAEVAAPTMADLRDIQNNASADPKTLTDLQRKRVKAYNRYIDEGKTPAQAAGYAYRDVVAQPEGERVATATGEVPRTKRGKADTGRTLTLGSAEPATPLSLRGELEPLLRAAEEAAGTGPIDAAQRPLFEEEEAKLGTAFSTPEEFAAFLRSSEANAMRGAVIQAKGALDKLDALPGLQARVAELAAQIERLTKLRLERNTLKELTKNRDAILAAQKKQSSLNAAITKAVVGRMELLGQIQALTEHKQRLEEILGSKMMPGMRAKNKVAPAVAATEKLRKELSQVLQQLEAAQASMTKMMSGAERAETMLRALAAQNRLAEMLASRGEAATVLMFPDSVIENAQKDLAAAIAELAPVQKAEAKQRLDAIVEAGNKRREQAAVEKAKAEQARTDARKEEQRRLEAKFSEVANSQVVPALDMAQRDSREMGPPSFNAVELANLDTSPAKTLGGYRSAITNLEKAVRKAQEKSKQARLQRLNALKARVIKLEEQYRNTKSADEREALTPKIEAATDDYAAMAEKLNALPLTWKGMAAQIKQLSILYNKMEFLEAKIGPNGEYAASIQEERDNFRALLNKEARENKAKEAAAKKKAAEAAEAKEAASRADAPTTTGEALTRTQVAKARKAKKTVFGTATGSAAEATAAEATAIQARAVAERTVIEARAKLARGEELTDLEKSILAQADAKAKTEEATAEEATAEEATAEEETVAEEATAEEEVPLEEEVNTEPTIETVVGPEAATVVKAEVAKLAPEETAKLEEAYGAKKNSKKFLAQLSADIVDMVNNGGRAVAKGIRAIVNKIASGVLATAMIFNPQFSATHLSFDLPQTYKQTITQQVDIRAEVPAEAREQMSPLAQMVYENMAPAAKASGKGFGIVDKPNGTSHYFKADGSLIVQGATLTGKDVGDVERGNSLTGGAKITPAGKFTLAYTRDSSYTGGYRFDLAETFRPGEGVIAIHAVYVGDPKENRLGRLLSPTGTDNRISYGCINTTNEMFVNKLMPNSSELNGGMLLVLPDATEKTAEMFPKQVQTVTKTFEGVEKTAKTGTSTRLLLGKEEKLNVDSLKSLYRTSKRTGTALKPQTIRGLVDSVVGSFANVPEIEIVENERQLPDNIRAQAKADKVEGSIPGVFDPNSNKVYLVASNLFDPADVFTTIAHEVTGHFGLRSLLGAGYAAEMNRIYNGNRDVKAKADAKMRETPSLNQNTATEEVLADMAERDPNAKGPGVLRAVYDALRSFIRRVFGQSVSDKQVQQLVANARRHVVQGGVNRVAETGKAAPLYRVAKPKYESENALTDLADRIIAQPEGFIERNKSNLALKAEMNAVDMRAGLQEALKRGAKELGKDDLFTQAMYNVRKADQYMPLVYTALSNGPLEFYTDDKGLRGLRSSNQNPAQDIFNAVKAVPGKNTQAKFALASTYMIAQRAANKGLSKLDIGELGLKESDLAAAMAAVNADPELKSSLEEVRRQYNAYNEGQIKLLADAGVISKAEAKQWLKDGDYVPYYRVRPDGTAELVFGGEKTLTIGDIRTQPYLAELKGGESKILPLNESLIRNTMLITRAALTNNATKEIAYAMQEFGEGKGADGKNAMPIKRGHGPAGTDIIRFKQEPDPKDPKDDGQRWLRISTKNTTMEGIPAEMVVKSLEGAHLTLPAFLKIGGIAGDWLRKGVTRMPPYIFRQLIRDPMAASFTGGLNYGPFRAVVMAGAEFLRSSAGRSAATKNLIEKGLIQSGIFTGDPDDMSAFATQLASGKDGSAIDRLMGLLDRAAIRADAATRGLVYENARKNGLSEVEADLMTMESMNFYKRGLSPTVQYANRLYPFMNAQIQGLNVLAKAMRGKMPFEERQRIQRKFWNNAVMLFGVGLVYAMAMEDDETFKNAKPRDKYTNFFVHLPGVSEPVKIPLPYESGWFFTAAVALADAMKAETNSKQQLKALRDIFLSSIPGYSSVVPQAVKPLFEVWTNKNFFSGQNIESISMQNRSPEERFNASTTEAAKMLAKVLPLSPVQIEHIARGYFGTAPLALMSVASSFMREETKGEAPARRLSETPILGTVFQKKYGGADADTMYAFAKEATQRAASLKDIQKNGTPQDAKEYLANHRTEIMLAPMARNFEMLLGRLRTQEDVVRNRKDLNAEEKRARLDQLDKVRQDLANKFNAAVRKVEERQAS